MTSPHRCPPELWPCESFWHIPCRVSGMAKTSSWCLQYDGTSPCGHISPIITVRSKNILLVQFVCLFVCLFSCMSMFAITNGREKPGFLNSVLLRQLNSNILGMARFCCSLTRTSSSPVAVVKGCHGGTGKWLQHLETWLWLYLASGS